MIIFVALFIFVACTFIGAFIYFRPIPVSERSKSRLSKPLTLNLSWVLAFGLLLGAAYALLVPGDAIGPQMTTSLSIAFVATVIGWGIVAFIWRSTLFPTHVVYFTTSHLVIAAGLAATYWLVGGAFNA